VEFGINLMRNKNYVDRLDRIAENPKRALELLERVKQALGLTYNAEQILAANKIEAFLRGEDSK
jgi:hypothetical protein